MRKSGGETRGEKASGTRTMKFSKTDKKSEILDFGKEDRKLIWSFQTFKNPQIYLL